MMKTHALCLAVTLLLVTAPLLVAEKYLTEAQALKIAFPQSQSVNAETRLISDDDRQEIKKRYGIEIMGTSVRIFSGRSNSKVDGYAVIDSEVGKSEPITFIVAIDPLGKVQTVAIMEFRETRGWEVKEPRFLRQFHGKRSTDHLRVNDDVVNLSGATLSSYAVTKGVKKAVVLVDYYFLRSGGR
ncbi:MAG: FMN-binding protein [Acidobacteriia bacterium]|nr:FMN-binding protein [Terriglobia bacterium]